MAVNSPVPCHRPLPQQLAPELRKILLHPFVFQRPETDDEINDNSFDPAATAGFKFHMSVFPAFHFGYPNIHENRHRNVKLKWKALGVYFQRPGVEVNSDALIYRPLPSTLVSRRATALEP